MGRGGTERRDLEPPAQRLEEGQGGEQDGHGHGQHGWDPDLAAMYRRTTVAQALADALAELSGQESVPMEVLGATMEAFDKVGRCDRVCDRASGWTIDGWSRVDRWAH